MIGPSTTLAVAAPKTEPLPTNHYRGFAQPLNVSHVWPNTSVVSARGSGL